MAPTAPTGVSAEIPTHPRETFDGWATVLDLGDWSYVLDDADSAYGTDLLWPYHRTSARLSPDTEYRSWRNEYVLLYLNREDPARAEAILHLALRPQGTGAWTVPVHADLDLYTGQVNLDPDDLHGYLREQALTKARRILDLLAAERDRRDNGTHEGRAVTAYERWIARQQRQDQAVGR